MSKRDTITVVGHVATDPQHAIVGNGLARTTFRLAVTQSRFDRAKNEWDNSDANWYTVTAFRALAVHVSQSVRKGERVIVSGNLRIREWRQEDRHGTAVDIDADAIGHDLAFGTSVYTRVARAQSVDAADARGAFDPDDTSGTGASTAASSAGIDGDGWALPGTTTGEDDSEGDVPEEADVTSSDEVAVGTRAAG